MKLQKDIYRLIKKIPRGKVTTYGTIARELKISARSVGQILHRNPDPAHIPCHRVVDRNGRLAENFAFGGAREQYRLLFNEGVKFKDFLHVDLEKYL